MNNLDKYLFRGRSLNGNDWVYGYAFTDEKGNAFIIEKPCIMQNQCHDRWCDCADDDNKALYPDYTPVIPASVGQWTGLTDKNGLQIFEGDHVVWSVNGRKEEGVVFNSGTGYDILAPGVTEWGIGWDCYRGEIEIMKGKNAKTSYN